MAQKRISMHKIREIIRLHEELKMGRNQIALALKISRPVVSQYLTDYQKAGLTYKDILTVNESELFSKLQQKKQHVDEKYGLLLARFESMAKELKRPGVTRHVLWEEYKAEVADSYEYSRFCYHFQVWQESSEVSMHLEQKAGEKVYIDFAGKKLTITDAVSKVSTPVEVFIALPGASQLTYVEAVLSQKKHDLIQAAINTLEYFEGVPQMFVPDCLKSAVTKGDKYEADINPEFADFARHYGMVILPARPHRPKDKALVENAVQIIYHRVYAPLRDRVFYSLEALNEAILELLEKHNNLKFQRLKKSRRELFEEVEKPALKPLPPERYEQRTIRQLKVQFNYHLYLAEDGHYYSVPWRYAGKQVQVLYSQHDVDIYLEHVRIALHKRDFRKNGYSTLKEHMPPHHKFVADWTPEKFTNWAMSIGAHTGKLIQKVLEDREVPEQAYRSCLGILSLAKKYSQERLEGACKRALEYGVHSYKKVNTILEKGLDRLQDELVAAFKLPVHTNLRGSTYYQRELE